MPQTRMPRVAASTRVTPEKWAAVCAAVREAGERFADLILFVPDHSVLATKDWSVAETAAHVTAIAWNYTATVAKDGRPLPIPDVRPHLSTATFNTFGTGLNPALLRGYPERDPARLAERLRAAIAQILSTTA